MLNIDETNEQKVLLAGESDIDGCIAVRKELELLVRRAANQALDIDFSAVESVSSAMLSMMLCCMRVAEQVKCQLTFSGLPQRLYDMARVGGLESVLPIGES